MDKIEGEVLAVVEDNEQLDSSEVITKKRVTGLLETHVRERVGKPNGVVESEESIGTNGTCDWCGSDSEGITILVDDEPVFHYSRYKGFYEDFEKESPLVALENWLQEGNK